MSKPIELEVNVLEAAGLYMAQQSVMQMQAKVTEANMGLRQAVASADQGLALLRENHGLPEGVGVLDLSINPQAKTVTYTPKEQDDGADAEDLPDAGVE